MGNQPAVVQSVVCVLYKACSVYYTSLPCVFYKFCSMHRKRCTVCVIQGVQTFLKQILLCNQNSLIKNVVQKQALELLSNIIIFKLSQIHKISSTFLYFAFIRRPCKIVYILLLLHCKNYCTTLSICWTPTLRLKTTATNPAFRCCRLLVLVLWFSTRKFSVCPEKVG